MDNDLITNPRTDDGARDNTVICIEKLSNFVGYLNALIERTKFNFYDIWIWILIFENWISCDRGERFRLGRRLGGKLRRFLFGCGIGSSSKKTKTALS